LLTRTILMIAGLIAPAAVIAQTVGAPLVLETKIRSAK
jgi:hypothetical protein